MGSSSSIHNKYSEKTSSIDIMNEFGTNAQGKYVIITGANCGLGLETARALAEHGAVVTIACRNPQLGAEAVSTIKARHPQAKVSCIPLDLSSLASIKQFVDQYKATKQPLHLLINNAGIMACPKSYTKDGFETQFGVNHLGHFYLTNQLIENLKQSGTIEQPSRVINLASVGHYLFALPEGIQFNDLHGNQSYDIWERYGMSKLANILFSNELNRRMKDETNGCVISIALHPGMITSTNLKRHESGFTFYASIVQPLWRSGASPLAMCYGYKTIEQGSATTLFCALSPDVIPGEYYVDCQVEKKYIHKRIKDLDLMRRLWDVSVELTKLNER